MSDLNRLRRIRDREAHGIPPEHIVSTDEVDSDVRFLLLVIRDACHGISLLAKPVEFPNVTQLASDIHEATTIPPRRKRCSECGGEGETRFETAHDGPGQCSYPKNCGPCNGTGYTEASK